MRRAFDLMCAAVGLLLLGPLFVVVAVAIEVDDWGPVFYGHRRVGRNFHSFCLLKFRSMVPDAESGGPLTAPNDPRLTRVGRFLRRYKLDELPQLINVLKGDIQLVGARPEVRRYVEIFQPQYALLLQDRPGITDPATLAYRHEERVFSAKALERQYVSQILPDKLKLSLEYQRCRSFRSDLGILFRTVLGRDFGPRDSDVPGKNERRQPQTSV